MTELKEDIAADRDRLAAENEQLRAQLAAANVRPDAPGVQGPARLFLSEGDRQDLELHGRINIGGRSMTKAEVEAELQGGPQAGVEIAEPTVTLAAPPVAAATNIRGFDYVYPSVSRGKIDPKAAGTPGVNGPAATPADVEK